MTHGRKITGTILGLAMLAPLTLILAGCAAPNDADIKKAIEIVGLESKWVAKEYKTWPRPKLVLVPTITFRVKNLSAEPLKYVNFNALFKEANAVENNGDNFLAAIRNKPVPPGELSDPIFMKSNFGVEGMSLKSFQSNPEWKTWIVKLFIQMKGSRHVPVGEWTVSRTIDFKEDVSLKPAEKKDDPAAKK
jgi:hypothetical protein